MDLTRLKVAAEQKNLTHVLGCVCPIDDQTIYILAGDGSLEAFLHQNYHLFGLQDFPADIEDGLMAYKRWSDTNLFGNMSKLTA
jgi:hypothetical protein